jgi:hypothetical protein
MQARKHSSDYAILIALGLLAVAVLVGVALMGWQQERGERERWMRTTNSTNIEGTKVCCVLYERLGLDVRQQTAPLLTEGLAGVDVLYVLSPLVSMQDDERVALAIWVRNGGVLVGSSMLWDEVLKPTGRQRLYEGMNPMAFRLDSRWDESLRSQVTDDCADLPLARDVAELDFGLADVIPKPLLPEEDDGSGVKELLVDTIGVRAVLRPLGQGYVIVLATDSFLANGRIGRFDNALAAVNLACYALSLGRGGVLAFDEYHFGFGSNESAWGILASLLVTTPAGWCVLVITAAGLLLLFSKGRRFGVRRAPGRPRRRSKLEFVESVGATFRAAGADYLTFEIIYAWFRRRAATAVGLPRGASSGEIAGRLARRAGRPADPWQGILRECDDALGGGVMKRRQMNALLDQLARIESEALHGH